MLGILKLCKTAPITQVLKPIAIPSRCFSNRRPPEDLEDRIVLSDDGRTVVCWHPEKPFPYECSLPLPERAAPSHNSVLKVQATAALKAIQRPKTPELVRQELMSITHTQKHIWFPCNRKWKRKKTPMDRPYL